jgi:glycosyltransferase involved in cell wall biosynthesis
MTSARVSLHPAPRHDAEATQHRTTLKEHSIIYFGNDWFGENRTSSHHIARHLSAVCDLLYVEVPGLRAPALNARDVRKLWRKLKSAGQGPRQIGPRMWHMTLPQIPFRRFRAVRMLNRRFALFSIRRAIKSLRFSSTISWFLVPHAGFLAGQIGEKLVVYYCIDDYASLPHVDQSAVAEMDAALTRRADLVFASSRALVRAKATINPAVMYSPHGVDVTLFRGASDPLQEADAAVRNLSHPVVGFFGVVDERIDTELILFLARQRPQWTFLLVGRIATDEARLRALPNILCPGPVVYESLPHWARAFDVCIMPYRQTPFAANANPLKLREYLATGKPVVSVRLPEVESLAGFVEIADTPRQFLEATERALTPEPDERQQARLKFISQMTWENRAEDTIRVVERFLRASC